MTRTQAFHILGLREDAAGDKVKHAYAQKLKGCSPETDPKGWSRLYQAYKTAMQAPEAEAGADFPEHGYGLNETVILPNGSDQAGRPEQSAEGGIQRESVSNEELFGQIGDLADRAKQAEQRDWRQARPQLEQAQQNELRRMSRRTREKVRDLCFVSRRKKLTAEDLKTFFESASYQYVREKTPVKAQRQLAPLLRLNQERFEEDAYRQLSQEYLRCGVSGKSGEGLEAPDSGRMDQERTSLVSEWRKHWVLLRMVLLLAVLAVPVIRSDSANRAIDTVREALLPQTIGMTVQ